MSGRSSSVVPARQVELQDLPRAQPVQDPELAKHAYDDYQDGKLKYVNRMIICGIAVVLLWCTSLQISILIVENFIASPSMHDIYDTCNYAYDVTEQQKTDYDDCTQRQLTQCNYDFTQAYGNEEIRVTKAFDYNNGLLDDAAAIEATCTTAYTNAQGSMDAWSHNFPVNYSTDVCTPSEIEQVKNMVGDINSLRSATYNLANGYQQDSTSRVNRIADYSVAVANYNDEYVQNKTSGLYTSVDNLIQDVSVPNLNMVNYSFVSMTNMVNDLVGCISMNNNSHCKYGQSAAQLYQETADTANEWMNDTTKTYHHVQKKINNFNSLVDECYTSLQSFYGYAAATWTAVDQAISAGQITGFSVQSLGMDKWDPSNPANYVENFFAGALTGVEDLIDAPALGDALTLFDPVKNVVDIAWANVSLGSLDTWNVGVNWFNGLNVGLDGIDFTPNDYHPPKYQDMYPDQNVTVQQEAANQQNESATFLSSTAVTLNAYDQLSATQDSTVTFSTINLTQQNVQQYLSGYSFTYAGLTPTSYNVKIWMVQLGNISAILIIFDYLWRAFHTLRLVYQYWHKSAIRLPVADIRKDKKKYNFSTMGYRRMALLMVTNPLFFTLLGVFFLAFFVYILSAAYIPIYEEYVGACVQHTRNDTFLTSNLYSVAYNYASQDGNDNANSGMNNYNQMYTDYCSTYGQNTQTQQDNDELYLNSIQQVQETNVANLALLDKCIDKSTMDDLFQQACCGLVGYEPCNGSEDPKYNGTCPMNTAIGEPYAPISTYVTIPECSDDLSEDTTSMENGVFQCTALPTCSLTCDGPDKTLLKSVTKQCGCMVEWGANATFFQISIAIIVFAGLNGARALVVKGIVTLNWKKLTPNLFEYMANCRRNGKFVEPEYRQKDIPYSQILRAELDKKLRNFELMGYMYILLAVVVNVPWVVFLSLASADIQYNPNDD